MLILQSTVAASYHSAVAKPIFISKLIHNCISFFDCNLLYEEGMVLKSVVLLAGINNLHSSQ